MKLMTLVVPGIRPLMKEFLDGQQYLMKPPLIK